MPEELTNYALLLARLQDLVCDGSRRLIGIEGYMAAGKTHLAKKLAMDMKAGHIEIDDSSSELLHPTADNRNKGRPYITCLDLSDLSGRLAAACVTRAIVIVEGICLRDVLETIGKRCDLTVYIKCISRDSGLWHDNLRLADYETGREKCKGLHLDQFEYHSRVHPHEIADLVWIRQE